MKTRISTFIAAIAFLLLGTSIIEAQNVYFKKNGATVFQSAVSGIDSIVFKQELEIPGVISVIIPQGAIVSKTPKVELLNDSKLYDLLDEFKSFLYLTDINKYQIRLDIGNELPISEEISVKLNIPESLSIFLKDGKIATMVALIYQVGDGEILDNFEPITSLYDDTGKIVEAKLPFWVFTNERTGSYEAIISIALFDSNIYSKSSQQLNLRVIGDNECGFKAILPVPDGLVTSKFTTNIRCVTNKDGKTKCGPHLGNDYRALDGSPVVAVMDGVVKSVKVDSDDPNVLTGYGYYIVIDHGANGQTLYGHLINNSAKVKKDDIVKKGQIIALSGNTGFSTGSHLHIDYSPAPIIPDPKKPVYIIHDPNRKDISRCIDRDYSVFPEIKKPTVSKIKSTSATFSGEIVLSEDVNYVGIHSCGFWYDTQFNPQISGENIPLFRSGSGEFTSDVTDLKPETKYYVRTYTDYTYLNGLEYETVPYYSDSISFTTGKVQPAKISTIPNSEEAITAISAVIYGDITYEGDPSYTEKGICWSSHSNSTINDNKEVSWSRDSFVGEYTEYLGAYSCDLTGLEAGNVYYARAYAIQNNNPIYGNEISFNTPKEEPDNPDWVLINGVKWATRNVGASSPEDFGGYYQWNTTDFLFGSDYWNSNYWNSTSWLSANDPSPAGFRVPTQAELQSLLNTDKVNCSFTTLNGIYGLKFIDKAGGMSIFLPAAGQRYSGNGTMYYVGSHCFYWSATYSEDYGEGAGAYELYFGSTLYGTYGPWIDWDSQSMGFSIRPVAN